MWGLLELSLHVMGNPSVTRTDQTSSALKLSLKQAEKLKRNTSLTDLRDAVKKIVLFMVCLSRLSVCVRCLRQLRENTVIVTFPQGKSLDVT